MRNDFYINSKDILAWKHGGVDKAFSWKVLLSEIFWRLLVQSQQQLGITKEYLLKLNTCVQSWLTELEQSTLVVQIKVSVRHSVRIPEFDMKHLKKAEGYISRNVVSITIKIRPLV